MTTSERLRKRINGTINELDNTINELDRNIKFIEKERTTLSVTWTLIVVQRKLYDWIHHRVFFFYIVILLYPRKQ